MTLWCPCSRSLWCELVNWYSFLTYTLMSSMRELGIFCSAGLPSSGVNLLPFMPLLLDKQQHVCIIFFFVKEWYVLWFKSNFNGYITIAEVVWYFFWCFIWGVIKEINIVFLFCECDFTMVFVIFDIDATFLLVLFLVLSKVSHFILIKSSNSTHWPVLWILIRKVFSCLYCWVYVKEDNT